jgi:hypothetical protein
MLPKVVYVYQEKNRDNSVDLLATSDLAERGEGLVGIYDLREVVQTRYQPQVKRVGTKTWVPLNAKVRGG